MRHIPYILLTWSAIGCWFSLHRPTSIRATVNLAACVALYHAVRVGWLTRRQVFTVVTAVVLVNVAVGLMQVWPGIEFIPQAVSPSGLMANKNLLASLVVAGVVIIGKTIKGGE